MNTKSRIAKLEQDKAGTTMHVVVAAPGEPVEQDGRTLVIRSRVPLPDALPDHLRREG